MSNELFSDVPLFDLFLIFDRKMDLSHQTR
jgi:hypothetical protein